MLFSREISVGIFTLWHETIEAQSQCANIWCQSWQDPYEDLLQSFAGAELNDRPEDWDLVIIRGENLRALMRAGDGEETILYIKLVALTDTITNALRAAARTPINLAPPLQDDLVERIIRLEREVDEERKRKYLGSVLHHKLNKVAEYLNETKNTFIDKLNIAKFNLDYNSIVAFVRHALEALKHAIDLLYDERFTRPLRKQALATWYGGRRLVRAFRRRIISLNLTWKNENIFEEFDKTEPSTEVTARENKPSIDEILTSLQILIDKNHDDKQNNSTAALQSLIDEFKMIGDEILELVHDVVENSETPVALAYLAERAQKTFGHAKTIGTSWAGTGGFLNFVSQNLHEHLCLTERPPHYVYDPARHSLPITPVQSGGTESSSRLAELQRSITRIYEACQAPPLPPSEYQLLFTLIAAEVREFGFAPNRSAEAVISRASAAGIKLSAQDVGFVINAVDEIDPWLAHTRSPAAVARAYRDYVLTHCAQVDLDLTDDEYQLIQVWFGASQWTENSNDEMKTEFAESN